MTEEMSFHDAIQAISDVTSFIEDSGTGQLFGMVAGFAATTAIVSHLQKRALFAEQERQITPDEWESIEE